MVTVLTVLTVSLFTTECFATHFEPAGGSWVYYDITYHPARQHLNVQKRDDQRSDNPVVTVAFKDTIQQNGWSQLNLTTNASFNNTLQAYASGYAEGVITRNLIRMKLSNAKYSLCPAVSTHCDKAYNFFKENMDYMKTMIDKHASSNPYWQQVQLLLIQTQGMEDGYQRKERVDFSLRLDPFGLISLNNDHDLTDILAAASYSSAVADGRRARDCSAFIKLLPDDLMIGHATWRAYTDMLRMLKSYDINFVDPTGVPYPGNRVVHSSEPGYLYSSNDFYMMSSKLVTLETTLGNRNRGLNHFIKPKGSVLEWIRNLVANRLASTGREWARIFAKYNSGTYDNQWMVVDYKQFIPGQTPLKNQGLLVILEQLPGFIVSEDVTHVLARTSYWGSYNYPYTYIIARLGGFLHSGRSAYDSLPRAKIFARNQSQMFDMEHLVKLMRYNDYKHDPLSSTPNGLEPYDAMNAVASRGDLNQFGTSLFGATDMKTTSYALNRRLEMIAECGPTHDQQPVFKWSDYERFGMVHEGMPDVFDFSPVHITWE